MRLFLRLFSSPASRRPDLFASAQRRYQTQKRRRPARPYHFPNQFHTTKGEHCGTRHASHPFTHPPRLAASCGSRLSATHGRPISATCGSRVWATCGSRVWTNCGSRVWANYGSRLWPNYGSRVWILSLTGRVSFAFQGRVGGVVGCRLAQASLAPGTYYYPTVASAQNAL